MKYLFGLLLNLTFRWIIISIVIISTIRQDPSRHKSVV
jgi:hypothetical protein